MPVKFQVFNSHLWVSYWIVQIIDHYHHHRKLSDGCSRTWARRIVLIPNGGRKVGLPGCEQKMWRRANMCPLEERPTWIAPGGLSDIPMAPEEESELKSTLYSQQKPFFFSFLFFLNYPNNASFCQDLGQTSHKRAKATRNLFRFSLPFSSRLNLLSLGASSSCCEASVPGICLSAQSLFSDALIGFCLVWTCLDLWSPFVKVTQWLPYRQWAQNFEPRPRIVPKILAYLGRK